MFRKLYESHNFKLLVSLGIAVAFALSLFLWTVANDLGVSTDSVTYIRAARSLMAGEGYRDGTPIVHYPPAYSGLLALAGLFTHDVVQAARGLHALLYVLNITLVGLIVYLSTGKSIQAMLLAMLVFISSARLLKIHSLAWTEPPFFTFSLAAFLSLALYLHKAKHRSWLLYIASIFAGLAILTRYVGITLLPALVACLIFAGGRPLKKRVQDSLILLTISLMPYAFFLLRNLYLASTATDRNFALHLATIAHIKQLFDTLYFFWFPYNFWSPIEVSTKLKALPILLASGFLLIGGAILSRRTNRTRQGYDFITTLGIFVLVFVVAYVSFLLATISFADASTPLDYRLLSPVYVWLVPLVVSLGWMVAKMLESKWVWVSICTVLALSVIMNIADMRLFVALMRSEGIGFTSRAWLSSESIQYTQSLRDEVTIYSNAPDAINYFRMDKLAVLLPAKTEWHILEPYPQYQEEMEALCGEVADHRAIIIYLDHISRWFLPTVTDIEEVCNISATARLSDGVVFGQNAQELK